jgi:hypothetical protein
MFENIETKVETVTRNTLIISLSEAEVTEALVNPHKLMKRLRQERAKWHQHAVWSSNGHAGLGASLKDKKQPGGKAAEKKVRSLPVGSRRPRKPQAQGAKVPCPICGELKREQGLHKHMAKHAQAVKEE